MSTADEEAMKRRYREFLDLLPMTLAVAGLAPNSGPRSYGTDQMEARAQVVASAFKISRQTVRDAIRST